MRDIIKAIEVEKNYLEHRMKNEEPFHLVDAIKDCGFDTLESYFAEKNKYQFKQFQFAYTEVSQEDIVSEAVRILTNKLVGVWSADSEKTCVFNGFAGMESFNADYCIENNIPVFPLLANGGTIVHQSGDYSWGVACPDSFHIDARFLLTELKDILQKHTRGIVSVSGNDILVNGKKVCGSTTYNRNGIFLFIAYFSFNDKSELIEKICNKQSNKAPGYIDFITREDFKQEVLQWLTTKSI